MNPPVTRIGQAALLIGAGIVAAAQIGKVIAAIPVLQEEMKISLAVSSWLLGAFSTLGALGGIAAGLLVQHAGPRMSILFGCMAIAIGSLVGAMAAGPPLLLASRIVEGVGFLGIVLGVPALLAEVVAPRDQDLFFGLWGTFMPTGTVLMLLLGPALPSIGWRALWWGQIALALGCAVLVWKLIPATASPRLLSSGSALLGGLGTVFRAPGCLALGCAFLLYAFAYMAIAGFVPALLVGQFGVSLSTATLLGAAVVAMNAVGNLTAGFLLRLGVPLWLPMATTFTSFALLSFVIFGSAMPAGVVVVSAAIALGIGGLTPASLFAGVPRFAPKPRFIPALAGLLLQASNIGQFAGPVVIGASVDRFGWGYAPAVIVPVAAFGLAAVWRIRRALDRGT